MAIAKPNKGDPCRNGENHFWSRQVQHKSAKGLSFVAEVRVRNQTGGEVSVVPPISSKAGLLLSLTDSALRSATKPMKPRISTASSWWKPPNMGNHCSARQASIIDIKAYDNVWQAQIRRNPVNAQAAWTSRRNGLISMFAGFFKIIGTRCCQCGHPDGGFVPP